MHIVLLEAVLRVERMIEDVGHVVLLPVHPVGVPLGNQIGKAMVGDSLRVSWAPLNSAIARRTPSKSPHENTSSKKQWNLGNRTDVSASSSLSAWVVEL